MTHHAYRIHEHKDSDARKQLFMKHKEAWAKYAEQATGKKVFYLEGSLNVRAEFCQIFAGEGEAIREPMFELADGEKIVDLPTQADVFVSGAAYHGIFYDTCMNPLMSLAQLNARIREYVGERPPLRQGGVAILVTPCDGTIDERWRPADLELLQIFNRLGHDPSKVEYYEEEHAHREDPDFTYRYAYAAHPLHALPVFYQNALLFNLPTRLIFY